MFTNDQWVQLFQAILIFAGGIATTYITVSYKNRTKKKRLTPDDREAFLFDRYEKALTEVDDELESARRINAAQGKQIEKMQDTINGLREDLKKAHSDNRELQLANIKLVRDYKGVEEST